jgi:hypothetical protein
VLKGTTVPRVSASDLLYALLFRPATTSTTNLAQSLRPSRILTVRCASVGITARSSLCRYHRRSSLFDRSILKDSEQPFAVWRIDRLEREYYRKSSHRAGICVLEGPFTRYRSLHCLHILTTLSLSARAPTSHITPLSYEPPVAYPGFPAFTWVVLVRCSVHQSTICRVTAAITSKSSFI